MTELPLLKMYPSPVSNCLKTFECLFYYTQVSKTAGCMANSIDTDQTRHFVVSDLGVHCCQNTKGTYGTSIAQDKDFQ